MKNLSFLISLFLLFSSTMFAQVAINTDGSQPNNSAMLDVKSSEKGMLIPRMTTSQRTAITLPIPDGLLVYDTDTHSFWFVKNSVWTEITSGGTGNYWSLAGTAEHRIISWVQQVPMTWSSKQPVSGQGGLMLQLTPTVDLDTNL